LGKKSILILGSVHQAALEIVFSNELTRLGIRNRVLGVQNLFLNYYQKSRFHKLIFRIGLSTIISRIQVLIKNEVEIFMPDVVLIFKGMEVVPATIIWLKTKGVKVVNFNPDHPFVFSGKGSGNQNVTDSIPLFDLYVTYDETANSQLIRSGVNSIVIPFGFDKNGFSYHALSAAEEKLRVCFLGNADKFRVSFINQLASHGLQIDVFGENWSNFRLHNGIVKHGPKYGQAFWDTLQKYAVQLNLLRPHNMNSHNMRSFDIPGAGGIMLAPKTPDHELFFLNEQEIFLFENLSDALQQINKIIDLGFDERNKIRLAARRKAVDYHTYTSRVSKLVDSIERM
jgi:spore maturation protein CgeB